MLFLHIPEWFFIHAKILWSWKIGTNLKGNVEGLKNSIPMMFKGKCSEFNEN